MAFFNSLHHVFTLVFVSFFVFVAVLLFVFVAVLLFVFVFVAVVVLFVCCMLHFSECLGVRHFLNAWVYAPC